MLRFHLTQLVSGSYMIRVMNNEQGVDIVDRIFVGN